MISSHNYLELNPEIFERSIRTFFYQNLLIIKCVRGIFHLFLTDKMVKYPISLDITFTDFHYKNKTLNFYAVVMADNLEWFKNLEDPNYQPQINYSLPDNSIFFIFKRGWFSLSKIENLKKFLYPFLSPQLSEILTQKIYSVIKKYQNKINENIRLMMTRR